VRDIGQKTNSNPMKRLSNPSNFARIVDGKLIPSAWKYSPKRLGALIVPKNILAVALIVELTNPWVDAKIICETAQVLKRWDGNYNAAIILKSITV